MTLRASALLLAALAALAACTSEPREQRQAPASLSIGEARRLPVGTTVTVAGAVTVASGALDSGFAVQDATGGLRVYTDSLRVGGVGQRVAVSGALERRDSLLGIAATSVEVLGAGGPLPPRRVRTADVSAETEGWLVAAEGSVVGDVVDDRPYGWKVTIDDGSGPVLVFVALSTGIDVSAIRAGDRLEVVGFGGRYQDHFEVMPRTQQDIRVLEQPAN
jgi:hypothetical protein